MGVEVLTDDDLATLGITSGEIIAAIETTLRGVATGEASVAPKSAVIAPDGRYMMATLSSSDAAGLIVVKSVMVNDRNKARDLPGINGGIMLLDAETGALRGVMDANWVTALRTAGLSAVAAKRLASPDSREIGLIGAGVQAESHLRMFHDLYPLERVRVYGRGAAGIAHIKAVAADLGLDCEALDARACLEGADIVVSSVTLNYDIAPFLDARWLKAGAFAAITDLGIPWVTDGQNAFGRVYVDNLEQERASPKPLIAHERIDGDLTDLLDHSGHSDWPDPSAFLFRGIAAGDLAVAALAFSRVVGRK